MKSDPIGQNCITCSCLNQLLAKGMGIYHWLNPPSPKGWPVREKEYLRIAAGKGTKELCPGSASRVYILLSCTEPSRRRAALSLMHCHHETIKKFWTRDVDWLSSYTSNNYAKGLVDCLLYLFLFHLSLEEWEVKCCCVEVKHNSTKGARQ